MMGKFKKLLSILVMTGLVTTGLANEQSIADATSPSTKYPVTSVTISFHLAQPNPRSLGSANLIDARGNCSKDYPNKVRYQPINILTLGVLFVCLKEESVLDSSSLSRVTVVSMGPDFFIDCTVKVAAQETLDKVTSENLNKPLAALYTAGGESKVIGSATIVSPLHEHFLLPNFSNLSKEQVEKLAAEINAGIQREHE